MSRFKDFDVARAERAQEPLTFVLAGETFTVRAIMPAATLLNLARAQAEGDELKLLALVGEFIESIVPEADHERFLAAMGLVDQVTMFELVAWVVEETTGRPFGSRSPLPSSPSAAGGLSKLEPLSWESEARSA